MHKATRASGVGKATGNGSSERQGANDGTGITCLTDRIDAGNIG